MVIADEIRKDRMVEIVFQLIDDATTTATAATTATTNAGRCWSR